MGRFGKNKRDIKKAEAVATLMLTARGSPFIYYGEEIGMTNTFSEKIKDVNDVQAIRDYNLAIKQGKTKKQALKIADENNRDKARSPMQWNKNKYAGFSNKKPWIKVNENYKVVNVETEEKNKNSILNFYKKLIKIRQSEKVFQFGVYTLLKKDGDMIYFKRKHKSEEVSVLINFGKKKKINFNLSNYNVLLGKKGNYLNENGILILKK